MSDRQDPDHPTSLTYADAGVDIAAGNQLVERIKPAAAATARPGVVDALGGFGALFDLRAAGYDDPVLVAATDGVGTKLRIAIDTGRLDTIGIDLVAMCANDLICQGAEPLFFLDYFATGRLSIDEAARVVEGIAEGCKRAGAALIGGETAEMPGMYAKGDFDLAGFAVGALERGLALPRGVAPGNVLIGLPSDGIHSNGYSLVRRIVEREGLAWTDPAPFAGEHEDLAEALLVPTRIYVRSLIVAIAAGMVKGLAHITGGGLTENVPRIMHSGLGAAITLGWEMPPVFRWLIDAADMDEAEALKTFNCGIGMVAVAAPESADDLIAALEQAGERAFRIGFVEEGDGCRFEGHLA